MSEGAKWACGFFILTRLEQNIQTNKISHQQTPENSLRMLSEHSGNQRIRNLGTSEKEE